MVLWNFSVGATSSAFTDTGHQCHPGAGAEAGTELRSIGSIDKERLDAGGRWSAAGDRQPAPRLRGCAATRPHSTSGRHRRRTHEYVYCRRGSPSTCSRCDRRSWSSRINFDKTIRPRFILPRIQHERRCDYDYDVMNFTLIAYRQSRCSVNEPWWTWVFFLTILFRFFTFPLFHFSTLPAAWIRLVQNV